MAASSMASGSAAGWTESWGCIGMWMRGQSESILNRFEMRFGCWFWGVVGTWKVVCKFRNWATAEYE